jgi:hypothetical protein
MVENKHTKKENFAELQLFIAFTGTARPGVSTKGKIDN